MTAQAPAMDRREFLRLLLGASTCVAGAAVGAGGCGAGAVPKPCPPIRPAARVLSTRYKPSATSEPYLWVSSRELSPPGNWSPMTGSDFMTGMFNIWDIDEVSVPIGSAFGCLESHVLFTGTPSVATWDELLYQRQRQDGSWTPLFSLSQGIGGTTSAGTPTYPFGRVSAARVGTELHVCGTTSER